MAVNPQGTQLAGYSHEELLGMTLSDLIWGEDLARDPIRLEDLRDGGIATKQQHILRKDGSLLPVEIRARLLPEGNLLWIVHDITERKRTEAALHRSEERFRRLAENAQDMICRMSLPEGIYEYVSPAAVSVLGYSPEELYTSPLILKQIIHPDWHAYLAEQWAQMLAGHVPPTYEYQIVHKSGETRWLNQRNILLRDAAGHPIAIEGIVTDITERKRAEEELAKSEDTLRCLFRAVPVGLSIVQNRVLRSVNDRLCLILGYSAEQLLGHGTRMFYESEEEYDRVGRTFYNDLWATGSSYIETLHRRSDGSVRDIALFAAPLRPDDRTAGVAVATQDITERKRSEEEKTKLQDQLVQAQKMESVGRLAGGIAHDFNNMLGVILGHAELGLLQTKSSHPLHAALSEIQRAAQRSASLTRQLLAFARKQPIVPKALDLNDTMAGMLMMLRRLIGENINLIWKPGADLWHVKMDPSQLDQLLANLCVNARDAIAGVGNIVIETGNATFDETFCADHRGYSPGEFILLSVSDNGCGMDEETLSHIFEPFFTTKNLGQGTGLGLATVYGVVNQNEGFVHVSSKQNMGTTFRIYFPRHAPRAERAGADIQAKPAICNHETVLVVEDEPAILQLSKSMLEKLGFQVLIADSPSEAFRRAKEYSGELHLLMTDVLMPEMNGQDLAKHMLTIYPQIKLLFMSGYTNEVIAHRGILKDGMHFIQKPFSTNDLAAKVREAMVQK